MATTVPDVLHPVGDLPAAVYWRRRVVALLVLLAVLGGLGWLTVAAVTGRLGGGDAEENSDRASVAPVPVPALERVVPSLASVRTPAPLPADDEPSAAGEPAAASPAPAGPSAPPGPCTDEMLGLEVRTPPSAPVGSKPTFDLVVTNTSPEPCTRALDKNLQVIELWEPGGARVWGSNDCFPEASSDLRTLAPGEAASFAVVWGGLTSEPGCAAPRVPPRPGDYVLRGRLDTKQSADAPLRLE